MKRFSFGGIDKIQDFCASKNPRAGTKPTEAEADQSLTIVSESPQAVISETRSTGKAPSNIWRDNIDGYESEGEISDIGERTNADFSGDEDEAYDIIHLKSVNKMNEYIEKPTVLDHGKKRCHDKQPKWNSEGFVSGSALFVRTKKRKKFPIHSRILIVKHRTKVFKTFQWC